MKVNSSACRLNEVTNQGQNESKGLPTLFDRLDSEGDIEVIIVARMNCQMIGQRPKAEKEVLFVRGNWKKDFFSVSSRTAVSVTRCVEAETPGKSGAEFSDKKITGAFPPNSTEHRSPVKESTLRRNPSKKLSKPLNRFLHPSFLSIAIISPLSLNWKKEERKEKRRRKDIYVGDSLPGKYSWPP